ncbi:MAG: crossover junction endodeoxyribonuclease RuvC, partial [Oscillospiraceae bacterium]|nr:crossover junction endodeoxyribonuclease RuvC [Oscillospiraceae bacterium]
MVILGIDPGVATIGFGVIRAERQQNTLIQYGTITTPAGIPLASRLYQISNDMEELIHTFQPDEMAIEELFFNTNITTGISVAHGRGVILLAAEKLGVPIFEYTPMQVKQAVVGYGKAEKKQVMLMTQRLLRMNKIPRPDD